jgi:hypothetical protein
MRPTTVPRLLVVWTPTFVLRTVVPKINLHLQLVRGVWTVQVYCCDLQPLKRQVELFSCFVFAHNHLQSQDTERLEILASSLQPAENGLDGASSKSRLTWAFRCYNSRQILSPRKSVYEHTAVLVRFISHLFFAVGTSNAQQCQAYCLCKSNKSGPFKMAVPDAGNGQCRIACASSVPDSYPTGYQASGCKQSGGGSTTYDIGDLSWAIWHEGAIVWRGDDFESDDVILNRIIDKQKHDPQLQQAIRAAGAETIAREVRYQAIPQCQHDHPVRTHLEWVCNHEHKKDTLNGCAKAGNIDCVRNTFYQFQNHDPNVRGIVACYNTTQLVAILKSDCGYDTWFPPPPKPLDPKEPGGGRR